VFNPVGGAAYDAGGLCGVLFCPLTNRRAESPLISTLGASNLTLEFDYISNGDGLTDNASVWYNDGTGWTQLAASIKSPICFGGQGQWQNASFALPASTNNIANLQIGFNWTNNDDGVGSDPSVAINNVRITMPTTGMTPVVCTHVDSIPINQPPALVLNATGYDVSCNGGSDGAAVVNVSGGTPGYSVVWSNMMVGDSISGLTAGSYTAVVVDTNGCVDSISVTISQPAPISLNFNAIDVLCNGDSTGCAAVNASGGSGAFTYLWSTGDTIDSICGLAAGTYVVTVTDSSSSSSVSNVVIYTETFDSTVTWTNLNVSTGINGADNNFWVINDNEGGVAPPGCGVANNGDNTLHITSVFCPTCGAAYDAGGLCG
ncbi:MAG: SprB repeat-containing protein, partial [Bacteroidota bacterium]